MHTWQFAVWTQHNTIQNISSTRERQYHLNGKSSLDLSQKSLSLEDRPRKQVCRSAVLVLEATLIEPSDIDRAIPKALAKHALKGVWTTLHVLVDN